jgi:hypothetical protein
MIYTNSIITCYVAWPNLFTSSVSRVERDGSRIKVERSKQIAKQFFEQLGFAANDIPETDAKRADLDVDGNGQQYIVEVKEKLDTGSQLEVLKHSYPNSDRKITREPHSASNRLDGVMKNGRKQLQKTPANPDAIRLIFLYFAGPNAEMFGRRALYTLYGVQDVIPVSIDGEGLNCVYFHNSFAFNSPDVDGVILMKNDSLQLSLNEFGNNYNQLQNSKLVSELGNAVYDPAGFDAAPGKIVLRSSISRRDENEVLDELERQTGIRYATITLHRYNL